MDKLVTIITCTGHRPEAFALCKYFVERQKYTGKIQWVIVYDEKSFPKVTSNRTNISIETVKGPKLWVEDYNTHRGNMETALAKVKGDYVLVMEDDDYYKADYIQTMVELLQYADAVGVSAAKYYNVKMPGYKTMNNIKHASLSQTAFKKHLQPELLKAVTSGDLYFDINFWNRIQTSQHPTLLLHNTTTSVGIKGLPGREGITPSHRQYRDYFLDPSLSKLKEWIGESDLELYTRFTKKPAVKK
jgi:hypothetical protein